MDVVSVGALRTSSLLWQDRPGRWVLTVVCKATFELLPGQARFAEHQEDPSEDDNHWDDDRARSVYSPSDMSPVKPRADVVLVGHAFAPRGEPVRSLVARLAVGSIDKRLPITGDFTNGAASRTAGLVPLGFGPIGRTWPARVQKLGRYARSWSEAEWHRRPLPSDLDTAYFNVAPPDQQLDRLEDDAAIVLENLHPKHAVLETRLPGIRPRAFVERGGAAEEVAMTCDTLWIDTDRSICTLTWRGRVALHGPAQEGVVLVALESGRRLAWADVAAMRRRAPAEPTEVLEIADDDTHAPAPIDDSDDPDYAANTVGLTRAQLEAARRDALPFAGVAGEPVAAYAVALDAAPPPLAARPMAAVDSPWAAGAAVAGAGAASDAAAQSSPWVTGAPRAAPEPVRAAPRAAPLPARPREIFDLLWFDPPVAARLRADARHADILAALAPPPPKRGFDFDEDDEATEITEAADRRDVFGVLTRAVPIAYEGVFEAMADAVTEDGRFTPPLEIVAGELFLPFDELETLKATVTAATPLAAGDEKLGATIEAVNQVLKAPWLTSSSGVAEGLTTRIKDALAQGNRSLPASYLDAQAERMLREQRSYQRRKLFGATWLRALLTLAGSASPIPTYVPESLLEILPMFPTMSVRLLVEAHAQQDPHESHPIALRVFAFARQIAVPTRGARSMGQ